MTPNQTAGFLELNVFNKQIYFLLGNRNILIIKTFKYCFTYLFIFIYFSQILRKLMAFLAQ